MLHVAITGHTSGIGLGLSNYFTSKGHRIQGFSRGNGYNIGISTDREKIVCAVADCDIFINNAPDDSGSGQKQLIDSVFNSWIKYPERLIINISSRWTDSNNTYCTTKKQLDEWCLSKLWIKPTVVNLKPGLTCTTRVKNITGKKMDVSQIVNVVDYILVNRSNFTVHSITFGQ